MSEQREEPPVRGSRRRRPTTGRLSVLCLAAATLGGVVLAQTPTPKAEAVVLFHADADADDDGGAGANADARTLTLDPTPEQRAAAHGPWARGVVVIFRGAEIRPGVTIRAVPTLTVRRRHSKTGSRGGAAVEPWIEPAVAALVAGGIDAALGERLAVDRYVDAARPTRTMLLPTVLLHGSAIAALAGIAFGVHALTRRGAPAP